MKILVVGLGALGTVYSCLLKKQGHKVAGVDREDIIRQIAASEVRVNGIWGDHIAQLDKLYSDISQIPTQDFDLIILTVKSFDTGRTTAQIKKILGPRTYVLLAQNGYGNYEAAAQNLPEDRLILGRVIFGAETLGAGISKVTVIADDVRIGSPQCLIETRIIADLARLFSGAGIPTQPSDQVMKYVWGKIIYNSALNSLGAILEVSYGELAANEHSQVLMNGIISEIFQVLEAMGQETLWPDAKAYIKDFYAQMVPSTAAHHASMLQDIQRGRKTEIDALNGSVVDLGKNFGVSTPVNEVITTLVKAKEISSSNTR